MASSCSPEQWGLPPSHSTSLSWPGRLPNAAGTAAGINGARPDLTPVLGSLSSV